MLHVIGLSGGKDSTALAFMLKEREPQTDWTYICTPTGDESPEMIYHWCQLESALGKPIIPIGNPKAPNLDALIELQGMLPSFRARFCTRMLKIEPTIAWCVKNAPVLMHVGLRADEDEREGIYGGLVQSRFPFREWGIDLDAVLGYCDYVASRWGIIIPTRTDCLKCYHQRIEEWWNFWHDYPERFWEAVRQEQKYGHTFRSPGRDSWPVALADLGAEFQRLWDYRKELGLGCHTFFDANNLRRVERGGHPLKEKRNRHEICRVCTL